MSSADGSGGGGDEPTPPEAPTPPAPPTRRWRAGGEPDGSATGAFDVPATAPTPPIGTPSPAPGYPSAPPTMDAPTTDAPTVGPPTSIDARPGAPDPLDDLDGSAMAGAAVGGAAGSGAPARRSRSASAAGQRWSRLLHVYTSMVALLLVLFFGFTGLTLNHPEWTFGMDPSTSVHAGTLPAGAVGTDGRVEFLRVSEYLRTQEDVRGNVTDFGTTEGEGFISYRGPGYTADVRFNVTTGAYTLSVQRQGLIGIMNDLHKGRDTTHSWSWVIDVAAVILVAIALTGLFLQLFLRRRRTSALVVATLGGIVAVVIAVTTLF